MESDKQSERVKERRDGREVREREQPNKHQRVRARIKGEDNDDEDPRRFPSAGDGLR